jgi:eukaryotic-like serine/threonine-protein kinase
MALEIDKLLFAAASGLGGADERRAFLEFACRDDAARLTRLEELLEIQRDADEFFEALGARIGPYRFIDRLGSGGCGVVYLAEQQAPVKRQVALKIIRLGMDTESVIARFEAERRGAGA